MFGLNDNDSKTQNDTDQKPADNNPPMPNPFDDSDAPVPEPASAPEVPASAPEPTSTPAQGDSSLVDIKQQALQKLQPLVNHLEQSPEEKFKTTMMLIQATDNPSLVKQAYEAANQITDEKARAQALLDVVNEINYFTHQGNGAETKI